MNKSVSIMLLYLSPGESLTCPVCSCIINIDNIGTICRHVAFIDRPDNDFIYWADHLDKKVKKALELEIIVKDNINLDGIIIDSYPADPTIIHISHQEEPPDDSTPMIIVGITLVEEPLK